VSLNVRVQALHRAFPIERTMALLRDVAELDRYQASRGIEAAAVRVADEARRVGCEVQILKYPADGARHAWTFRAPRAWTPVHASLRAGGVDIVEYPKDACSIARYSAATQSGGVHAPLRNLSEASGDHLLRGAVVLVPRGSAPFSPYDTPRRLARAGALGFVTDAVSPSDGAEPRVGRLELPSDTPLFAFSVHALAMAALRQLARVHVNVAIDRSARMPIVVAHLPGETGHDVWLTSHLCHPRPGANDNGSGVAALIGIATALERARASRPRHHGVRFVWGPEFTGAAAYLHRCMVDGAAELPFAVVNVDMVGENPGLCGGPLILESSPDHVPSFLDALAAACASNLPVAERAGWSWRPSPFRGLSDHALFADRSIARPAIQITHWPDRFNHTSADTIDKVDPDELRRSATIAASVVDVLTRATESAPVPLAPIVASWAARLVSHAGPMPELRDHLRRVAGQAHAAAMAFERGAPGPRPDEPPLARRPLTRRWDGPFNVMAAVEDADERDRAFFHAAMAKDKRIYSTCLALALSIDGRVDRDGARRFARLLLRGEVEAAEADRLLSLLISAGWITEES
jgi:hypothetical protein